jgi:hypothetical protein
VGTRIGSDLPSEVAAILTRRVHTGCEAVRMRDPSGGTKYRQPALR